jgi:hypothetical protein
VPPYARPVTSAVQLWQHLLDAAGYQVAVEPPGEGTGYWAGGPSAVWDDGFFYLAYRLRRPVDLGRGYANVVARSQDGVAFEPVATVTSEQFGAASLERPALVPLPAGGWRLYVSCSTVNSKHWWVETVEADDLGDLADGRRNIVLPGDQDTAWKDVVVRAGADQWQMWACRHPLDGGDDEADRMTSVYFVSPDGLAWTEVGTALAPTPGTWDARGARITSVLETDGSWFAFYDGRASAADNWFERTGVASGTTPAEFTALGTPTPPDETLRYVSVAEAPDGQRLYWEASRPDGANELRTAYVPRPVSPSQS